MPSLSLITALLIGCSQVYVESNDAGNDTIDGAENTGIVVPEFGKLEYYRIEGNFDSADDRDFYAFAVEDSPSFTVNAFKSGSSPDSWDFNFHRIQENGEILTTEDVDGQVLFGEGETYVLELGATFEGAYQIDWANRDSG